MTLTQGAKTLKQHHATTIILVRHNGKVAVAGDGQVTLGHTILKGSAKKIRRLYQNQIICGFAGSTADALTILERFEDHLSQYSGNFTRAAVELSKKWRTDRGLRHLEAVLLAADREKSLLISGSGDVLEPDDNILATGSGGPYALAAARALIRHAPHLEAPDICHNALQIASEICIYTNDKMVMEVLDLESPAQETPSSGGPGPKGSPKTPS
jgi:ATP-dependent HslUV protease subunit HslV